MMYVYYQWQSDPKYLIFWLFLDNLNISEQTIDSALTIYTELQKLRFEKKNNVIWFSPPTKTIHWL